MKRLVGNAKDGHPDKRRYVMMEMNQQNFTEIPQVDMPNEFPQVDRPEVEIETPHPQTTDPQAGVANTNTGSQSSNSSSVAGPIGFRTE
jgi:hypothetical protein